MIIYPKSLQSALLRIICSLDYRDPSKAGLVIKHQGIQKMLELQKYNYAEKLMQTLPINTDLLVNSLFHHLCS